MSKAFEILSQTASEEQKRRWAEGNAIAVEQDTDKNITLYRYADGSSIQLTGKGLQVH
ncbi:hypothetical protein [Herbaspirillum huttiense]|uniref:hypothetical protein n=1 Tax=Herbaspirillum huttiense TaxID=863372 RepID=UPI0039B04129